MLSFKRIRTGTFLFVLLSLFASSAAGLRCSASTRDKSKDKFNEWGVYPTIVLALSQAILEGIRHVVDEFWVSEVGFLNTDITITLDDSKILTGRITSFALHDPPNPYIFTRWQIYRFSNDNLNYTNTLYFDNFEAPADSNSSVSRVVSDSLFLQVDEDWSKLLKGKHTIPTKINIIYWRDKSKQDEIVTLQFRKNSENRFVIAHPENVMK